MSSRKLVPVVKCKSALTKWAFVILLLNTSQNAKSVLSNPAPITWANTSQRFVSEISEQVNAGNIARKGPIVFKSHVIIALEVKVPSGLMEIHPDPKVIGGWAVLSICSCETSHSFSLVFTKPNDNSELDWPNFIGTSSTPNTSDDFTTPRFFRKKSFVNSRRLSEALFVFEKNANVSLGFCDSTFGRKSTFVQNPKATTVSAINTLNVSQALFFQAGRNVATDCTTANIPSAKDNHHAQIVRI